MTLACSATLFAFVYFGTLPGFYLALRHQHSVWVVAAAILVTKACDIGAYFTGRAVGRHKLIPWLSPGKTWEGLVGGMVLSAGVALVLAAVSNQWDLVGRWVTVGGERLFHPTTYPLLWTAGAGLVLGAVGQLGDLAASLLKRDAGIKDSGRALPGFGGLLDVARLAHRRRPGGVLAGVGADRVKQGKDCRLSMGNCQLTIKHARPAPCLSRFHGIRSVTYNTLLTSRDVGVACPCGRLTQGSHEHSQRLIFGDFIIGKGRFRPQKRDTGKSLRVNDLIRISPIRLIDENNEQVGVIDTDEAKQRARAAGLDLVEVAPTAKPPVCRIMDYGKWKYQQRKKEQKAKAHAKQSELKGVRLRPGIDDHDLDIKVNKAREFLEDGDKVQFTMLFRGRQMAHQDLGIQTMEQIFHRLEDIAKVEAQPQHARSADDDAALARQARAAKSRQATGSGDPGPRPARKRLSTSASTQVLHGEEPISQPLAA